MRKILFFFTFLLISLSAISQNKTNYEIHGNCPSVKDGDTVYVAILGNRGVLTTDTAYVKSGTFNLSGYVEAATRRMLVIVENNRPLAGIDLILESGANITVNFGNNIEVLNSKSNDIWQKLNSHDDEESLKINDFWRRSADSTLDLVTRFAAQKSIDSISTGINNYHVQVIKENIPSNISGLLFAMYYDKISDKDQNEILSSMSKKMTKDPYYLKIMEFREKENETSEGKQYKDLPLVDLNGNMCRLSEIVQNNKLVLVDFWASWCAPCRAEMPNVKKIYEQYHSKGLEIYGVSLDENMIAWQEAVQKLGINWIHVSDLKGWQSTAVELYNIKGIPLTILIDNTGKIIARGLRGQELADKIAKILK